MGGLTSWYGQFLSTAFGQATFKFNGALLKSSNALQWPLYAAQMASAKKNNKYRFRINSFSCLGAQRIYSKPLKASDTKRPNKRTVCQSLYLL
jgi:hypothetical protein